MFGYVGKFHRPCLIFSYISVMLPIYAIVAIANCSITTIVALLLNQVKAKLVSDKHTSTGNRQTETGVKI